MFLGPIPKVPVIHWLRQVLRHGDCTYCLLRDHDTDSHISRAAGNPEKLQACGILDKSNNTKCPSNQNSAFHGAAGHKQQVQKGFHTRNKPGVPQESKGVRDSGQEAIRKEWDKSARSSRAEEMEEARLLLQQPEVDGDQVLLLIHEVTLVAGKARREVKATLFNDKGSTCTMISRRMVKQLELESISKSVIVQSFGHSDRIETEFVVLEILTAQAELKLVRAYVVDSITNMAKVEIPEELKEAFQRKEDWPRSRVCGEIDILLGIEELALHPHRVEIVGNLGLFRSPLTNVSILGGRHPNIHPVKMELSHACLMLRRAVTPAHQSFRVQEATQLCIKISQETLKCLL